MSRNVGSREVNGSGKTFEAGRGGNGRRRIGIPLDFGRTGWIMANELKRLNPVGLPRSYQS